MSLLTNLLLALLLALFTLLTARLLNLRKYPQIKDNRFLERMNQFYNLNFVINSEFSPIIHFMIYFVGRIVFEIIWVHLLYSMGESIFSNTTILFSTILLFRMIWILSVQIILRNYMKKTV